MLSLKTLTSYQFCATFVTVQGPLVQNKKNCEALLNKEMYDSCATYGTEICGAPTHQVVIVFQITKSNSSFSLFSVQCFETYFLQFYLVCAS